MKKLFAYLGILASLIFLLTLNTEVFSNDGCEDPECGAWNSCYIIYGQKLDGMCYWIDENPTNNIICIEPPPGGWKTCNIDISMWCCDIDPNCELVWSEYWEWYVLHRVLP